MTPLITIGLPVYNGERYLERSLDALQAQTFTEWKLRVSDNGSQDATERIVRGRAADDPRIEYVRQSVNRGASYNFSVVATEVHTPLYKWITHDDEMDPRMLERLLEAREADPDAVLWYPLALEIDAENVLHDVMLDRLPLSQPDPAARLRQLLDTYRGSNSMFGVLDARALATTRLLEDFHSSDVVLMAELAMRGRFVEVEEPLFHRRWMFRSTHGRTRQEVDEWWNPASTRAHDLKLFRIFRETTRSALRAPMPARDRRACVGVLMDTWGRRHWRSMAGELRRAALRRAGVETTLDY